MDMRHQDRCRVVPLRMRSCGCKLKEPNVSFLPKIPEHPSLFMSLARRVDVPRLSCLSFDLFFSQDVSRLSLVSLSASLVSLSLSPSLSCSFSFSLALLLSGPETLALSLARSLARSLALLFSLSLSLSLSLSFSSLSLLLNLQMPSLSLRLSAIQFIF